MGCVAKPDSRAAVSFSVENLDVDSIGVRVLHYMDGKELLDTLIAIKDSLVLPNLKEDMYLMAIYWPRTFVPHQIYNDKSFDKNQGDNYVLAKAFYVDPKAARHYVFFMDSLITPDNIELSTMTKLHVRSANCEACVIADQYWENYNLFFARKEILVDDLNIAYYRSVNQNNTKESRKNYLRVDSLKKSLLTDDLYKKRLDSLVKVNASSKASTFFVFYQLFQERDFKKYKPTFQLLTGNAKSSRYYQMLLRQYK